MRRAPGIRGLSFQPQRKRHNAHKPQSRHRQPGSTGAGVVGSRDAVLAKVPQVPAGRLRQPTRKPTIQCPQAYQQHLCPVC